MSLSLESFERVRGLKRNFDDIKAPLDNNNYIDNAIPIATAAAATATNEEVARSIPHNITQVISSSSSMSCEESCSSSSNGSAQTHFDAASELYTVPLLVPNYHRRSKDSDLNNDHSCSSSKFHRRNIQVMGQNSAAREPSQSNCWDDSSWNMPSRFLSADEAKGNNTVGASSATTTTIVHTRVPTTQTRSKHNKVQGIMLATTKFMHAERNIWDDTHWQQLKTLSSSTKKRKIVGLSAISTNKDAGITKTDNDTICHRRERTTNPLSKEPILPIINNSVKRSLCKIFSAPERKEPKKILPHMSTIPNRETGIARFIKNQDLYGHQLSYMDSPYIFYRWLRVRLAAGLIRSSFDFLHQILKKCYDEVHKVIRNLEVGRIRRDQLSSLVSLRDRLAGIWCVYAHFSLDIGYLVFARSRERGGSSLKKDSSDCNDFNNGHCSITKENTGSIGIVGGIGIAPSYNQSSDRKRNIKMSKLQNNLTFDDFSTHAISILMAARSCPLVGNHSSVAVSLGRLIVASTVMKESKTECARVDLSKETFSKSVQSAIDVCWDSIDVCRSNQRANRRYTIGPVSKTAIRMLSNFEIESHCSKGRKDAGFQVEEGINSTLLLPMTLRNSLPSDLFSPEGMIISDKDTIHYLCKELNRWSRLGEKLVVNSRQAIRISPSYDSEMPFAAEKLPLYTKLQSFSDPLNLYDDIVDSEKGIIWQW